MEKQEEQVEPVGTGCLCARALCLGGWLGEGARRAELKSCFQLLGSYYIGPSATPSPYCWEAPGSSACRGQASSVFLFP